MRLAAPLALALALVALAGCAQEEEQARLPDGETLAVTLDLAPRAASFGDPITATVGAVYDPTRVDPASLRLRAGFRPWRDVRRVERSERNGLASTTWTIRLSCLTGPCVTDDRLVRYVFPDAQLSWREGGEPKLQVLPWPELEVATRLPRNYVPPTPGDPKPLPWRAAAGVPEPTYRVDPGRLHDALLVLAAVFSLAAAGLVVVAVRAPRRRKEQAPLDRALALLERARTPAERRTALEAVAAELHPALAESARQLAWSEAEPSVPAARELSARVRGADA